MSTKQSKSELQLQTRGMTEGEIEQNRKTAMQRINEFSKEQLIDYILFGERTDDNPFRRIWPTL